MRRNLEIINVVDVEATCWQGVPPPGQASEIIEIGLCELRVADGSLGAVADLLVRPQRSSVSTFCTQLTTLTPEQVEEGMPFAEACDRLREQHTTRERVWASYGDYDRGMFENQCRAFAVEYPFAPRHLNVKTLVSLTLGLRAEVGMARALELLELPLEGTHHRAGDDARNIARILGRVLMAARAGLGEKWERRPTMAIPQVQHLLKTITMGRRRFLYGLDRTADDRLTWSPGGEAATPLQLAGKMVAFASTLAHLISHRAWPERPATPPAPPQTREEAKAAVEAAMGRLQAAVEALTEADLQQPTPTPWGDAIPLNAWLWNVPGVLGYLQGQLNYCQTAYGDTDANIPPEWGK